MSAETDKIYLGAPALNYGSQSVSNAAMLGCYELPGRFTGLL
jgi:hypothetical protein